MLDVIKALSQTSLPSILAFFGIFFIFLSIGGKLGAQVVTDNIPKRYAGIIGVILLLISFVMFVVSTSVKSGVSQNTQVETKKNKITDSIKTYKLRPTIPMNQPISQLIDFEWTFSSSDNSTECVAKQHTEYIFTILGRYPDGKTSIAKRKTASDTLTTTCTVIGKKEPQVTITHGELEGKELLARNTPEGVWFFDDLPNATEKQKYKMRMEGFLEPFSGLPEEEIHVGKKIVFKDQDVSLVLGTAFPGRKKGNVVLKFDRVLTEREPVAQLSISMDVEMNTIDENNNEIFMMMSLNGGTRLLLSKKKISLTSNLTGIMKVGTLNSQDILTGPINMRLSVQEL